VERNTKFAGGKQPPLTFETLLEIIEKAYEMEYSLYEEYENSSAKIFKTGDLCAFDFLQNYRSIQTKSVAEYSDMINMLNGTTGSKFELLMLEEQLFENE
jgi:ferritin